MFVNIIEIAANKGANSYTIHVVKIQNTYRANRQINHMQVLI